MHIQLPFSILLNHNKTDEWLSFLPQPSLVPWTSQVNRIALLTSSDHGAHPYHIGQKLSGSRCTRPFWDILPHPRTTSLSASMAWSCTPAGSDCAGHSSGFSALSSQNSGNGWVFQSSSGACFPHYTLFVLVHRCHENFSIRCCYLIPWINFSTYPTPSILHSVFLVSVIGITLVIRVKIFKDVFILEKFTHVFNEI